MSGATGRVTFLGTATSHGVPMIGCTCPVCTSDDPRDQRNRPSIYLELREGARVLVDTTPDLRRQALAFGLSRVDAILFTHCHADHVMGLDDVRRFNALQDGSIPCFGDARTLDELRSVFGYIFTAKSEGGGLPQITLHPVDGPFFVGSQVIVPVPVLHGKREILGYRIGTFAYLTDCSGIPETSWPLLDGVETLVIDALRHRPHPTHFSVSEALAVIARLGPERAYLTHVCHDLGHAATSAMLPAGVELAYDGLTIEM